jgi:hypothetical protein
MRQAGERSGSFPAVSRVSQDVQLLAEILANDVTDKSMNSPDGCSMLDQYFPTH